MYENKEAGSTLSNIFIRLSLPDDLTATVRKELDSATTNSRVEVAFWIMAAMQVEFPFGLYIARFNWNVMFEQWTIESWKESGDKFD